MAFRMADPVGTRQLARSVAGLYQGPRGLPGSDCRSRRGIMPFVRLWRALVLSFLAVALFTSGAFAQAVSMTLSGIIAATERGQNCSAATLLISVLNW